MKTVGILTVAAAALALFSFPAKAHDVPNMEHSHAFQKTGYGKYRQGHYVNGPQGSIIVWSPRVYGSYQARQPVNMARPVPITRPPGSPIAVSRKQSNPAIEYGKR